MQYKTLYMLNTEEILVNHKMGLCFKHDAILPCNSQLKSFQVISQEEAFVDGARWSIPPSSWGTNCIKSVVFSMFYSMFYSILYVLQYSIFSMQALETVILSYKPTCKRALILLCLVHGLLMFLIFYMKQYIQDHIKEELEETLK